MMIDGRIQYPAWRIILERYERHPHSQSTQYLVEALRSCVQATPGPVLADIGCLDAEGYDAFTETVRYRRDGRRRDDEMAAALQELERIEAAHRGGTLA